MNRARAALFYTALTIVMAYPLSVTPHRALGADDPDTHLFMWTLAWDVHALTHQPLHLFDANIFYPNRDTLAYSENVIGSVLVAGPVLWLTGNPAFAVTMVSLTACMLCGLGAFVLGRRLGMSVEAALLSGIVFAFAPPRFMRFSQLHLAAVQWMPLALASFHAYLDEGRRRDLLFAAALTTLQILTTGHGGIFLLTAMAVLAAYRLALAEPLHLARRIRDFGVAGVLIAAPSALMMLPYRRVQLEMGLRRTLDQWEVPLESFVASPTKADVFLQGLVGQTGINRAAGAWLFPGVLPVALAFVAIGAAIVALRWRAVRPSAAAEPLTPLGRRAAMALAASGALWMAFSVAIPLLGAGDGLATEHRENRLVVQTGYLNVLQPGLYQFGISTDAASRIVVDELQVLERIPEEGRAIGRRAELSRGAHRMLVQFVQREGQPAPERVWAREGDAAGYRPIPAWMLSRRPAGSAATLAGLIARRARTVAGVVVVIALAACVAALAASRRRVWEAWGARHRGNTTAVYLLIAALSAGLSLGAPYGLWQFVYWLPGFNFIRANSRFMILGLLAVAVLAGLGADVLLRRAGRPAARRIAAAAIGLLLLVEFSMIPYAGDPYRFSIPEADRWIARQPGSLVIAEVPVERHERYHTAYMLHSTAHWQKTVHGYSGILPPQHFEIFEELRRFPTEQCLRRLTGLGVTHLVVHWTMYPPEQRRAVEAQLPAFERWLKLEYSDAEARVYSLRAP